MKTLDEFMARFKTLAPKVKWEKTKTGIRTKYTGCCPGCFVASRLKLNKTKQTVNPWLTELFAENKLLAFEVADAADAANNPRAQTYHQRMLEVTRLK